MSRPPDEPPPPRPAPRHFACSTAGQESFFGPLVVTACYLDPRCLRSLVPLGLDRTQPEALSRGALRRLVRRLRVLVPHESVLVLPPRYNELHARMGGLPPMLAWAHGRALEPLARAYPDCQQVLCDRVVPGEDMDRALARCGGAPELLPLAPGDPSPALVVARLLARERFLEKLGSLGEEAGMVLPDERGDPMQAAKSLSSRSGLGIMRKLAKLHFQIMERLG